MRKRLRDLPDLTQTYPALYDHTRWSDHIVRVGVTVSVATWFRDAITGADLSCGDGAILNAVADRLDMERLYLGDFVPGYEFQGPIEETIKQIPNVDLFILSETIEHLEDPDSILRQIREKTKYLVLSTPDGEWADSNPEHVWGWDNAEIRSMLESAGFTIDIYNSLKFPDGYYTFQIWGCR